jgi:hypothetical protein
MSRWGNATPKDMSVPVPVFNRTGKAIPIQHGGLFYEIPSGVSLQDRHLAERVVNKNPGDVFYGSEDPNVLLAPAVEPEAFEVEFVQEPAAEAAEAAPESVSEEIE